MTDRTPPLASNLPTRERGWRATWLIALLAVSAVAISVAILAMALSLVSSLGLGRPMLGGPGMMGGGYGVMRGYAPASGGQPEDPGFVPGTPASPRIIRVVAGPDLTFHPSAIRVARGETVTFVVTTMGPTTHEFMVGPPAAVAADAAGTPEIDDLRMMVTRSLTFTFEGPGPYAYACHAPGHYEAGMLGTITVAD